MGKCLLCRSELCEDATVIDASVCHASSWNNLISVFTGYKTPLKKSATDNWGPLHTFCRICLNSVIKLYELQEKIETHRNRIQFILRISNIKKHLGGDFFRIVKPNETCSAQEESSSNVMNGCKSSNSGTEGPPNIPLLAEEDAFTVSEVTAVGGIPEKSGGRRSYIRMVERIPNCWYYDEFAATKLGDKYHCLTCSSTCKSRENMRDHLRENHYLIAHPDQRRPFLRTGVVCEVCGKVWSCKGQLRQHSLSHSSERPFRCSICNKGFKTATSLATHRLSHVPENERGFVCEHCGRRFATDSRLQNHLLSHTKEKKFQCEDCGRKYSKPEALSTHRNSHTGAKKYSCDICDMEFTQSGSVLRHKRTAHGFPKKRNVGGKGGNASSQQQSDIT